MSFSDPFVRRPVATMLLTASLALLGVAAYSRLPVASLPNIDRPTIAVRAALPGASADTVNSSLTTPLERQLGLISGLKEMHATSLYGHSLITLEFGLNKDIDAAAGAVQAAINAASSNLPKNMPGPPTYVKANPNGFPIIALALTSDVVDTPEVYKYADTVLAGKLSQIEGVATVFISGAARPGVRIQVNPRALADMHLSMAAVKSAVLLTSADLPKGEISDGQHTVTVGANDQLLNAADYRGVIVAWKNGAPVKLEDVAEIFDSTINDDTAGWFDSEPAVVLYVLKNTDANVVETVDAIVKSLPPLERWLPAGIKVHVMYDRTLLIRAAVADVQFTIGVAILLVVLVMLLFLHRFWLTVIPSLTIPVSLAATMGVIYLLGFSLDNISLLAVTIAVGFVIDDSVIIIENIARLVRAGATPLDAALQGTRQMGFTVISIAVALMAALIPVLFMPDIVGRLFREFGLTLVAAIAVSTVVSLTFTPMMCGLLLKRGELQAEGRFGVFCERALQGCGRFYAGSLDRALRHRWLMNLCRGADDGLDRPLLRHAERVPADARHRCIGGPDPQQVEHLIRGKGESPARDRGRDPRRPSDRSCGFLYRAGSHECRDDAGESQAPGGSPGIGGAGDRPAAREAREFAGREGCVRARPGHPRRCETIRFALPVHVDGARSGRSRAMVDRYEGSYRRAAASDGRSVEL